MLSIEKALEIYTDKLNAKEPVDLKYFETQLAKADYAEFLELIEMVKLTLSAKESKEFDRRFQELNRYKKQYYAQKLAKSAGFRADKGKCDKDAAEKLKKIFQSEFNDEK